MAVQSEAGESYQSIYQIPLQLPYCSSDPAGGQLGASPCDEKSYLHWVTYTGFQKQWNPIDPIRRCQQPPNTTCPVDNSGMLYYVLNVKDVPDMFRYYLPRGTREASLILYGPPSAGACATVSRFGKPPVSQFPSSYAPFEDPSKDPSLFPPVRYPDIRAFWNGKSIDQLEQYDWFAINQGGHITVLTNGSEALEEGGWLYVKFKSYDASKISVHSYVWGADDAMYTRWYTSYTSWVNGDPSEQSGNAILIIEPTKRDVAKNAGTTTFNVSNGGTDTMNWTTAVTSGAGWLKIISGGSGTNTGTITCSFDANTNAQLRTGTIQVTGAGATGSPQTVTVTQAGTTELSVTPASRQVDKIAGKTTFDVKNAGTGAMSWTAKVLDATWLTISPASGTANGAITCTYTANTGEKIRTATIEVTATGATKSPMKVTVNQAGTLALSVDPTIKSATKAAGSLDVSVKNTGTGTMRWSAAVSDGSGWLRIISGASGTNTGIIQCAYDANTAGTTRTGIIKVTADGAAGSPTDVKITQAPTPPLLTVDPTNRNVTSSEGSTLFNVSNQGGAGSTMNWTAAVTSTSTWLKIINGSSGTNTGTITCSIDPNTTTSIRSGTIRVTATGADKSPVDVTVTQAAQAIQVPYTGLEKCYDADDELIPCPDTEITPFYGQDANYKINAMTYVKLDAAGKELPDDAIAWSMVKDKVTGFVWEVKTKETASQTYSWFDDNKQTNGGYAGSENNGVNTQVFIKNLNDNKFGGFTGWRVPTIRELSSIVNYNVYNPTASTEYFLNIQNASYLTSTTVASDAKKAWGISFDNGFIEETRKDSKNYVMAVCDPRSATSTRIAVFDESHDGLIENASPPVGHYIDNGDGTITDASTNLRWEQKPEDDLKTWEDALAYCTNLNLGNYTDWRLPTIKELETLADYSRYYPALNVVYFDTQKLCWSATTYVYDPRQAWVVDFDYGKNNILFKNTGYNVRAVRNVRNFMVKPEIEKKKSAYGNAEFDVVTTGSGAAISWTANVSSGAAGWLSISSGGSGTGNGNVYCVLKPNNTGASRTGTIQVAAPGIIATPISVTVTQAAATNRYLLGVWSDGIWSWLASTKQWAKIPNTSDTQMIAAGFVDSDDYEDVIRVATAGIFVLESSTGKWKNVSANAPSALAPLWITAGDLTNDGRDDIICTWSDKGTYFRDSLTEKWERITSPAMQLAAGNIGGQREDLSGVWSDGLWVRYSVDGSWQKIDPTMPVCMAAGDMSGDNRADIVGSYTTGTWYRNSATKSWIKITSMAAQLTVGDINNNGRDDLIGVWGTTLWVNYGGTNLWQQISTTTPKWITTGMIKP